MGPQGLSSLKQVGGGSVGVEPVVLWGLLSYMRLAGLILGSYEAARASCYMYVLSHVIMYLHPCNPFIVSSV